MGGTISDDELKRIQEKLAGQPTPNAEELLLKLILAAKVTEVGEQIDMFKLVSEFNEKFQLPCAPTDDHRLPYDLQVLKITHLREELEEYEEAARGGDMEKAFDALIDLVYVALGCAYFHEFPFNVGFARVHIANMLKRRAISNDDSKRGSKYDVVKPEGWEPPSLADLV